MDKRVLLTVAISMAILFVWVKFVQPPVPQTQPPSTATTAAAPALSPSAAPAATGPAASPGPAAPQKDKPPAVAFSVERDQLFRATFTSWGAAPTEWKLAHKQYQESVEVGGKKELVPINLVRTSSPDLPLTITFPESDFNLPADAAWTQLTPTPNELAYAWEEGTVHVEKRFTFVPGTYQVKLKVTVENRGDKPLGEHLAVSMFGWHDPNIKPGGFFAPRVTMNEGMCNVNGKLKHADLQALLKASLDETGAVRWIGIDEKYFVSAVALNPGVEAQRCTVQGSGTGVIHAQATMSERKIAPHDKAEVELAAFFGPKNLNALDDVKVGGVDAKLGDAVNYGWTEAIARPMLAVLKGVHLAVIVLTILLKIITWWPTTKSMKSMKAMAKLKPEMDKLKEKYGDDKNRMNQEVMELYKKHGINPLGGCLPMLIQMPIYIALYSMLGNSVELYRSGFLGWIHDLTAPDPYFVLPLLTGALMFAQQKLSPAPPDPQQKMMGYMMPVMFTAISLFLPSGLTVYILTNTLLTMLQQWWMNRNEPKPTRVAGKPARA
jgi:YidC/Oxa1 family membrane protein insertase